MKKLHHWLMLEVYKFIVTTQAFKDDQTRIKESEQDLKEVRNLQVNILHLEGHQCFIIKLRSKMKVMVMQEQISTD